MHNSCKKKMTDDVLKSCVLNRNVFFFRRSKHVEVFVLDYRSVTKCSGVTGRAMCRPRLLDNLPLTTRARGAGPYVFTLRIRLPSGQMGIQDLLQGLFDLI